VPDLVCVFRQLNSFQFGFSGVVEQAQFDLGGMAGEEGEIHAKAVPGGT
jgi:hypothetical protein